MTGSRSFPPGLAPVVQATGTTGAPNAGRFVGVTTSGAPTTGTYRVGDYCLSQNGQLFACVTAGTPGTWVTPRDLHNLLEVGEETLPRDIATSSAVGITSGDVRLTYFTARKSETSTQVRMISGGTAAAATPTLCRIGLYSIASDGAGTLVASTPNDTAMFSATATAYTKSWSASVAKTAGQRYALGIIVITAAATPTFVGLGPTGSTSNENAQAPRIAGLLTGQSDLPASFTGAAISAGAATRRYYAVVTP